MRGRKRGREERKSSLTDCIFKQRKYRDDLFLCKKKTNKTKQNSVNLHIKGAF